MKRKIVSLILIVITIVSLVTISYGFTIDELTGGGDKTGEYKIRDVGNNIVKILGTIGVIVSVVMLIALGIKYMIGSTEQRAEYKKTLLPYVIGATLLFSASTIAQIIFELAIKL